MSKKIKPKVVIAMSGGVDSSVSAALLKKAGFDVVGVMMKFWKEGSGGKNRCCSVESEKLARLVAKQIGIPFYVVNVEREFKKKVVDYFLKEYKAGNTPNPCVVCNKEIKFGILIEKALKLGADFIATGHYAQQQSFASARHQRRLAQSSAKFRFAEPCILPAGYASDLLPRLFVGKDKEKDQSYFLWQLNQKQLSRVMFPVGGYTKPEVRKLAKKFKLPTAETPESQEVCFISGQTNDFLKKYLKIKPGEIVDVSGKVLGQHNGLWFYTIGQRRALEIPQGPWYVVDKNFKKNILIVSLGRSQTGEAKIPKDLLKKELFVKNVNWVLPQKLPINAEVKIRYKAKLAKAKILNFTSHHKSSGRELYDARSKANVVNKIKIIFEKPQKAITPGQSAVFYKGNQLLGGGIIE